MKTCKIMAIRKASYPDLMEKYENPIQHACDVTEGQVFFSVDGQKPQGFCDSAWESVAYFVRELANGGGNFYEGWMKNPHSAMISCNDGFRPVSFYIETIEEQGEEV
ncbi:MAG: TIGR04076 family protein [Clostridia bacterium]|nr:TIGR04076 family protein [Clostridia bacterium]